MNLLQARYRRRFIPRVEALEERSLLNASLIGGQIVTTGVVNNIVIADYGVAVFVYSDNGVVANGAEGSYLSVTTNRPGSTNNIYYDILGTRTIKGGLTVNFGWGNGLLNVQVVDREPDGASVSSPPGGPSDLGAGSNLQITTRTTAPPAGSSPGNTREYLTVNNIGSGANLQFTDNGGAGNDYFSARLGFGGSAQRSASTVALNFFGNGGNNTALVSDSEDIQAGATMNIALNCGLGNGIGQVLYAGQLQGTLRATDNGGPGVDFLYLRYDLAPGSIGTLISVESGGPGDLNLVHLIHKASNDSPSVFAETSGGRPSMNRAFVTLDTATSAAVPAYHVGTVIPVA
jgi:hypothetical protein